MSDPVATASPADEPNDKQPRTWTHTWHFTRRDKSETLVMQGSVDATPPLLKLPNLTSVVTSVEATPDTVTFPDPTGQETSVEVAPVKVQSIAHAYKVRPGKPVTLTFDVPHELNEQTTETIGALIHEARLLVLLILNNPDTSLFKRESPGLPDVLAKLWNLEQGFYRG